MKKLVGIFVIIMLSAFALQLQAQVLDPVLGPRAWKKENVGQREAIVLTHIREADVMWSERIWRELDLRQKINQKLYFPLDSAVHGKRSFIRILFDNYLNNPNNFGPNGVKLYKSSQFEQVYTWEEIQKLVNRSDTVQVVDDDCNLVDKVAYKYFQDVQPELYKVRLMEDWFIDKQRSIMDNRILGLGIEVPTYAPENLTDPNCQVSVFNDYSKVEGAESEIWIFFPQIRQDLAVLECFNTHNDAARLSYDDIFLQRIFSSYIYKKENVFDREISNYTAGLDALIEADRIKDEIFKQEQDLWQY